MSETKSETKEGEQPWAHRVTGMLDELTRATSINWGPDGDWRKYRVIALEQLSLPNVETESLPPMVIDKGGTAWLDSEPDPKASEYEVTNGSYQKRVPAKSVEVNKPGWSVPDHVAAPITLMCFELFPYAALHAGLMSAVTFFKGITKRSDSKSIDGSIAWAGFLGAKLTGKPSPIDPTAKFGLGDIIVICDRDGAGFHTVIASGKTDQKGGPMVYSLASHDKQPGHQPFAKVALDFDQYPYMRVFTPRHPEELSE